MQKHMVTCPECGRRFDANWGAAYIKESRRYMCPRCVRKHNKAVRASRAAQQPGQAKQGKSGVAMWLKLVFGALFVVSGFAEPESGWSIGYFLTALVLGGSLIAWALIPYFQEKKKKREAEAEEARRAAEEAERAANVVHKCPACGAQSKGQFCEYCGTKL